MSFEELLPRLPSSFPSCVRSSLDPNISHSSLKAVDTSSPWPHSLRHPHVRELVELAPIPPRLASSISLSPNQHPPFVPPQVLTSSISLPADTLTSPLQVLLTFRAHPETNWPRMVLLNPLVFPYAKDGDIIRITQPPGPTPGGDQRSPALKKRAKEGFLFQFSVAALKVLENDQRRQGLKVSSLFPSLR